MNKFIIVCLIIGLTTADNIDRDAEVLRISNEPADVDGNFAYSFETSNGINVEQTGNNGRMSGSASWISPEGERQELTYTADEFGYHPSGPLIPTPPPIPDYILRALEYIKTHQAQKR